MDFPFWFGKMYGDVCGVRLHGLDQIQIKRCDHVKVFPLLGLLGECGPWQVVYIPCVVQAYVGEDESDGSI